MDLNDEQVQQRLQQLARKMGSKSASNLLSVLGKDKDFINALDTDLGQELLKDAVSMIEEKIGLYLQSKDEEIDRYQLQCYVSIVNKWTGIINRYAKSKGIFEKNIS